MNNVAAFNIKPLFGKEFYVKLKEQISNAQERIFLGSAFLDKQIFEELLNLKPNDVPMYVIVRNNSNHIPKDDENKNLYVISVPWNIYHGKLYVIDNTFIVGSHNLLKHSVQKNEGEFSFMFVGDEDTITAMLFKSLYSVFVKNSNESFKKITDDLIYLYQWDECPFCGVYGIPDPFSIKECLGYAGYANSEECGEYRACKYCPNRYEPPLDHEIYLCVDGCGAGIDFTKKSIVFHHDGDKDIEPSVWYFIEVYNGLTKYKNADIIARMFRDLGFFGITYLLDSKGNLDNIFSEYFVSITYFKRRMFEFVQKFTKLLEDEIESLINGKNFNI